jgi:glycosyltransferase involved in cell wall biosynthesis
MVVTAIGSDLNRISDPLCGMFTRKALRHADFVHTVSGHLLKTARRMGASAKRSEALTNGCDTSVFYPRDKWVVRNSLGLEESGSTVVYVGRLDVRKGLRELIQAAGYLRLQRPNFRCYIVGDGPDRAILAEAIARLGARDRIILTPSCTTQQVSLWMAAADLVTLPSYAEGCPNVILEALASGRPVVASNVGGIPEIMDNRVGRLVPPRDVPALVKALGDVLDGKWNAAEIARQNRRSWSDVADEMENTLIRMHRAYSSS